jgi:hypothetical protein
MLAKPIPFLLGVAVNALFLAGVFVVAVVLDLGLMAWYRRRLLRKGLYPKESESDLFMLGGRLHLPAWMQSAVSTSINLDRKFE